MARTREGAQLTAQHRQAQLQVQARALRDYTLIWALWNGEDDESFNQMLTVAYPLIQTYHSLSAAVASAYYTAFRNAEKPGGSPTPRLAELPDERTVRGTLFLTGREMQRRAVLAGKSPEKAREAALVRTSGTTSRFVLNGGRQTLVRSAAADKQAGSWTRVTANEPCVFCRLLASRGPVYSEDTVDFDAHDHCSCTAEPHYYGSEWPGRAMEFRREYNAAIKEARSNGDLAAGTSNDSLNAYRRYLARQ